MGRWLFLGRLHSYRACLRFTSRLASCRERALQYNGNPSNGEKCLNVCLTPGDNPRKLPLCFTLYPLPFNLDSSF
jgi:hypothetical protein